MDLDVNSLVFFKSHSPWFEDGVVLYITTRAGHMTQVSSLLFRGEGNKNRSWNFYAVPSDPPTPHPQ